MLGFGKRIGLLTMRRFARLPLLLAACSIAGLLGAPSRALADGVSPIDATLQQKKEATDHFLAGKRAIAAKDWEKAVSELRASLEVVDSPNTHLELARALRDSGELGEAWVEYWRVAGIAGRIAPKDDRYAKTAEVATAEREEVTTKLALVDVNVEHAPADMTLRVAGRMVPPEEWGSPVPVPPGPVEVVVVSSAGVELARATAKASTGVTTPVSLDAQAPAAVAAAGETHAEAVETPDSVPERPQPTPAALPPPSADRTKLRPYAYVAGSLGVAGLATFAVFGSLASSTYNDLKAACPRGCPPGKQGEIDGGIAQQTTANVGLGVGLAALVAGTTLFFLSRPATAAAAPSVAVSPQDRGALIGVRGSL
jgi:hypothetical protein